MLKEFGVYELLSQYSGLHQTNQYLFAKARDTASIDLELARQGFVPAEIFVPAAREFPEGEIFHGTRNEASFRGILLQGIRPSETGTAGEGLYGVTREHKQFAIDWGGAADRVVRFEVKPEARIVDITRGKGEALFGKFWSLGHEGFAEKFGIDILKYPYGTPAYVVKNSAVLGKARGDTRDVPTFSRLLAEAAQVRTPTDFERLVDSMELGQFRSSEVSLILSAVTAPELAILKRAEEIVTLEPSLAPLPRAARLKLPWVMDPSAPQARDHLSAVAELLKVALPKYNWDWRTSSGGLPSGAVTFLELVGFPLADHPGLIRGMLPLFKANLLPVDFGSIVESLRSLLEIDPRLAEAELQREVESAKDRYYSEGLTGSWRRLALERLREDPSLIPLVVERPEPSRRTAELILEIRQAQALAPSLTTSQEVAAAVARFQDLCRGPKFAAMFAALLPSEEPRSFFAQQTAMLRTTSSLLPLEPVSEIIGFLGDLEDLHGSIEKLIERRVEIGTTLELWISRYPDRRPAMEAFYREVDPRIAQRVADTKQRLKKITGRRISLLKREDSTTWRLLRTVRGFRPQFSENSVGPFLFGASFNIPLGFYLRWVATEASRHGPLSAGTLWNAATSSFLSGAGGVVVPIVGAIGVVGMSIGGKDFFDDQVSEAQRVWRDSGPDPQRQEEIGASLRTLERLRCVQTGVRSAIPSL